MVVRQSNCRFQIGEYAFNLQFALFILQFAIVLTSGASREQFAGHARGGRPSHRRRKRGRFGRANPHHRRAGYGRPVHCPPTDPRPAS